MRRLAILMVLAPFAATAQSKPFSHLVFQGHNGPDWVATYGCGHDTKETRDLVAALKQTLALKTQGAVENGIDLDEAEYRGCVIGKSFNWNDHASYPPQGFPG